MHDRKELKLSGRSAWSSLLSVATNYLTRYKSANLRPTEIRTTNELINLQPTFYK